VLPKIVFIMRNSNLKCHIQNVHFKKQRNFIMQYSCVQHNIVHIEWSTILCVFPYNRKNLLAKWCPTAISCSVVTLFDENTVVQWYDTMNNFSRSIQTFTMYKLSVISNQFHQMYISIDKIMFSHKHFLHFSAELSHLQAILIYVIMKYGYYWSGIVMSLCV
jgi:hypothetical protein